MRISAQGVTGLARVVHWAYRYTNTCTTVDSTPSAPLTLADWNQAYAQGATLRQSLARFAKPTRDDDPAWIHPVRPDELAAQIDRLESRAARFADRAEAMRAMPLFGVPFAVKDNIDVAGWTTTAACPAFAHVATADAHVVARLRTAGAVCVGKTNLDQFATGLVGTRSPYGRPASTFDAARISGGSSSGSAVVVSRGDVPFALGTDTAGSGRVPAGFNQIVGLKPTPGRVGTSGVVPACRSLDCVSIFALTVADAAAVLAVIEGDDPADAYSTFAPSNATWPQHRRIGVPMLPTMDDAYRAPWDRAVAQARALGHDVVPIDFAPLHDTAGLLYGGPWLAERHAAVQALFEHDPQAFDPTVRQIVQGALEFTATDAFRGQYALRAAQVSAGSMWSSVDLLMVPTAPGHPTFADVDADPIGANSRLGIYTNFVNLLGWSALAVPAGATADGLPFGVTFIAPAHVDAALARMGVQWQQAVARSMGTTLGATGAFLADVTPHQWPAGEPTMPLAVVGAHLSGLPLNHQLVERGATLREATVTAPAYRLYALPGTTPPKPGMVRTPRDGAAFAVEVWDMPLRHVGSFLGAIPPPLGLGSVELSDGRWVHGFVCEAHAVHGAIDVTSFGGWRAYLDGTPAARSVRP